MDLILEDPEIKMSEMAEKMEVTTPVFCDHEEAAIRPFPDHVPGIVSPLVSIFVEEVRREASRASGACTCTSMPQIPRHRFRRAGIRRLWE